MKEARNAWFVDLPPEISDIDPSEPSQHPPGSDEKVAIIASRYVHGLPLWNDKDASHDPDSIPELSPESVQLLQKLFNADDFLEMFEPQTEMKTEQPDEILYTPEDFENLFG